MATPFSCPNCNSTTKQRLVGSTVFCSNCSSTYPFKYADSEDDTDEFQILPPRETKHDVEEFQILPPRDKKHDTPLVKPGLFSDSDEELQIVKPKRTKKKGNMFGKPISFSDSEDDLEAKPIVKRKRTKKTEDSYKPTKKPAQNSTALPDIFSDDILPDMVRAKRFKQSDDLLFSDSEDDQDPSYVDTREEPEYQDRVIMHTDPNAEKKIYNAKPNSRFKLRQANPKKKFSPFVNFNKQMRGAIAKENEKMLLSESSPQKKLSQLVAIAWKNLDANEKEKFNQELKEKKSMFFEARQGSRPTGNGFVLYNKETIAQVKQEFPDLTSVRQLSPIVGRRWKALDQDKKQEYKDRAQKEKEEWIENNPEEHQQYIEKMANKIVKTRKVRREARQRLENATDD